MNYDVTIECNDAASEFSKVAFNAHELDSATKSLNDRKELPYFVGI